MPSSKSQSKAGPLNAADDKKKPRKSPKPKTPKPHKSPTTLGAEPPIVVTSGSVEIEIDKSIFPTDSGNPNKHKNSNRKLTSIEIQDLSSPPKTLMTVDLKSLSGGKCKILIKYGK